MKKLAIGLMVMSSSIFAQNKMNVDITIDKLSFVKPQMGVGKAGNLIFKNANINNNGIILNINNVNNFFDSQIFVRPTFMGFTTQFGNYGFEVEKDSILNAIDRTELKNTKLIMDDIQLNLGGESLSFLNKGMSVKLTDYRLYCQGEGNKKLGVTEAPSTDMVKSCFNFLAFNGSYSQNNEYAFLVLESESKQSKIYLESRVKRFDLRKEVISADLLSVKTVSNDSYTITASEIKMDCAKDEIQGDLDIDKIKLTCLNRFKLAPMTAKLVDKDQKTQFNLDVKDITIKDQMAYIALNQAVLSNPDTITTLSNVLLNCKKERETDVLDINQVLRDCLDYSRISIDEVKNNKRTLDKNGSSIRNILVNAQNSNLVIQSIVKFLGFNAKVSIWAKAYLNENKKQLTLTVTDTKLPLGLTSVKLLMYFLKKDLISKEVTIQNNNIIISI